LCHEVVRTNGRGIPDKVIMKELKNNKATDWMRGSTKAAVLKNCDECSGLIVCSVADTKPVHLMSPVAKTSEWTEQSWKEWDVVWHDIIMLNTKSKGERFQL
jgi:hypothetical protein